MRARLSEINAELRAGKPVTSELKAEVRELSTQVNTQNRIVRLSSQAWLENHQTLQTTARIMSTVSAVARSALAITTAWSVATLAFGKTSSDLIDINQQIERTSAQLQDAIARGADSQTIANLTDQLNVLRARKDELTSSQTQGQLTGIINLIATMAITVASGITVAAKLGPILAGIGGLALGPLLAVAAAIAAIPLALYLALTPGDQVKEFLSWLFPQWADTFANISKSIDDFVNSFAASFTLLGSFFTNDFVGTLQGAWNFIVAGFATMWNGVLSVTNSAIVSLATIILSIIKHWDDVVGFFNSTLIPAFTIVRQFLAEHWRELLIIFTGGLDALVVLLMDHWQRISDGLAAIWAGITAGHIGFWNGLIGGINLAGSAIVSGIEGIANSFISFINKIIEGYNAVASALGLGKLATIPKISLGFTAIPLIAAANGFTGEVNKPTMFLAGEAGREFVNISPSGRSGGSGSGNVYITINGDVTGQEVVDKVRMALKNNLRFDQNYTGY